ncbi:MAG: hypothetical protein JRF63_06645 [Deltaproteobacteria bacterium]|nr:hypothetical protein [Deltaproteobacteria bacterium]
MTSRDGPTRLTGTETAWCLLDIVERRGGLISNDPLEIAHALASCIRAAHLIAFDRLSDIRDEFPASIDSLLEAPEPELELAHSDVDLGDYIGFIDTVDLLSDELLPCVAPRLHRGWQDKTQSCREARVIARRELGVTVVGDFRRSLLYALAIVNRTSHVPGPIELEPAPVRDAVYYVLQYVEGLSRPEAGSDNQRVLEGLRSQLGVPG